MLHYPTWHLVIRLNNTNTAWIKVFRHGQAVQLLFKWNIRMVEKMWSTSNDGWKWSGYISWRHRVLPLSAVNKKMMLQWALTDKTEQYKISKTLSSLTELLFCCPRQKLDLEFGWETSKHPALCQQVKGLCNGAGIIFLAHNRQLNTAEHDESLPKYCCWSFYDQSSPIL